VRGRRAERGRAGRWTRDPVEFRANRGTILDARAGAIATVVAVIGALASASAIGPLLFASLAGQAVVLGLLSVLAPLLVRSIGLIRPTPREPGVRTRVDNASVRAVAAGVSAAMLVLLWSVGTSVFAASMIPGAGFVETQSPGGVRWLVPVALVVGALRQFIVREVPTVRPRPALSRMREVLAAVPGIVLVPLLVLSLYRDAPLGLAGVFILVVLIRLVRLGVLASPLEFLLRRVLEVEQRIRGVHLFGVALVVSLIIGHVVGESLARIRSGYLLLLFVLLLLSRSDARSTVGSIRLAPPTFRTSAATAALTFVLSGPVLVLASLAGSPAGAQTTEASRDSVPDLVGATALINYRYSAYRYSALGRSGSYDAIHEWSASMRVVSAQVLPGTEGSISMLPGTGGTISIVLELEGTVGSVRGSESLECEPSEFGFPLWLVDPTASVEEVVQRLRGTAGVQDVWGDIVFGGGAYRSSRVLTRPASSESERSSALGCAEPVVVTGAILDGGDGLVSYPEDLVGRPFRLVPSLVWCFGTGESSCALGRIDELVHDLPVFVLPPPSEPMGSASPAPQMAAPAEDTTSDAASVASATDTGPVAVPVVPRSESWPFVPPLLALVLPGVVAASGVLAGGPGIGASAGTAGLKTLQQNAADVRWTAADGVGRPTIGLPDADLEELLQEEERPDDPT
jgi:hypothetical protein